MHVFIMVLNKNLLVIRKQVVGMQHSSGTLARESHERVSNSNVSIPVLYVYLCVYMYVYIYTYTHILKYDLFINIIIQIINFNVPHQNERIHYLLNPS